jgi:hypothetical protein
LYDRTKESFVHIKNSAEATPAAIVALNPTLTSLTGNSSTSFTANELLRVILLKAKQ